MSEPSSKLPYLTVDTEEFIADLEAQNAPPLYTLSPHNAREFLRNLQSETHKEIKADVADTNIFTVEAGNVDVRIVKPEGNNDKLPVIIYVHGGGWVMGDKEVFDELVRKLAVCTNSAVFFVNYALSPEAQYPTALNQIYGVSDYVFNHPDEFDVDSDRMAIAGDSAGANMAAVTTMRAQREKGPKFLFQLLFYPVTNADMDTKSYDNFKDGPWLTKKAMEWFWDAYVPDKKMRDDIFISPLLASEDDLKNLPPALIITAENDVLRDEGEAYARKLDAAGVDVLNVRINGTCHDFVMLNALSETEPAKGAIKLACKMLNDVLH